MIVHVLNWIMLLMAVVTAILSWGIYRITKAKSLLYIFVAMCIGVVTRLLIAMWGSYMYSTYPSFVFWGLWMLGLYLLLKLLQKYMKTDGEHDAAMKAEGKKEGIKEGKEIGKATEQEDQRTREIKDLDDSVKESKKEKKNG
jgi:hypothetical protein